MKKILLASLIGLVSASAAAQQEIKFVMEATYAPFEYMDENNQIQGFDVDLANALCKQLEAKCSFHNQAFDSLIPALKFKRYDAAISAMDITEARLEQVNFSNPYYDNSAAFVSLAGKVADQAALKGKRVGVQNGSTHQSFLLEQLSDVVAVPYSSYQDAFIDMKMAVLIRYSVTRPLSRSGLRGITTSLTSVSVSRMHSTSVMALVLR